MLWRFISRVVLEKYNIKLGEGYMELVSERLILREFSHADFQDVHAYSSNIENIRYGDLIVKKIQLNF